jgi:hypothetical protein
MNAAHEHARPVRLDSTYTASSRQPFCRRELNTFRPPRVDIRVMNP